MTLNLSNYPHLVKANLPCELRQQPKQNLNMIAKELRQFLLNCVSQSSGHFASGLGTVLHPFPWPPESEYDTFAVGHSSTSISAALGMAIAAEDEGKNRKVVAVIGDGALTAGLAFEALNHAGDIAKDLVIVLNDNEMSISENVGALNSHLARLLTGSFYNSIRDGGKKFLSNIPPIKEIASIAEDHIKGMVAQGTIFEELGFRYIGPIDGHDVDTMVDTLSNMRKISGPQILHVVTKKGKGYEQAEQDPIKWHAVPKFDHTTEKLPENKASKPSFSAVFGQWLCDVASSDKNLVAITPAMREGSGLVKFSKAYPEQYIDVAIAIDRAGIVGADGPTHQGAFDISYLRCIPNMIVMTPSDEAECRNMLFTGYQANQPAAVRYPRGSGTGADFTHEMQALPLGKSNTILTGKDCAILNFGTLIESAQEAANELGASLIDMRFVKPIDEEAIIKAAKAHSLLVTLEDGAIAGGAGSAVAQVLQSHKVLCHVLNLGLPDEFVMQGTQEQMYEALGLDSKGIVAAIKAF